MNPKKHLILLCLVLVFTGFGTFFYKLYYKNWPITANKLTPVWTIEARIQFEPEVNRPIKVAMFVPPEQTKFSKLDEHFVSKNYGITTTNKGNNRESIWTIRRANNNQTLYYQAIFYKDTENNHITYKEPAIPKEISLEGPERAAAEALVKTVRDQSADSLTFATEVVRQLNLRQKDENVRTLLGQDNSEMHIASTTCKILESPKIRSHVVNGFILNTNLEKQKDIPVQPMIAVWNSDKYAWDYINPSTAEIGLPDGYLIWSYGDGPLLTIDGGSHLKFSISSRKALQKSLDITEQQAISENSNLWKFSLFSLPLHTQNVYQVMIMLPIGAFIILVLRNIVGLKTFGTFMPVLVALAFRETNLLSGIILFLIVIGLGLLARFYLEHLKLLLVPRIACVLSIVVMIMIAISIFSYQLGIEYSLSIALFPMVIMTMTIERMSIVWEERNPLEAIMQVLGSLFAASIAYVIMSSNTANYLFFTFPELLLVLLAVMLLIGRYKGYRLSEIIRFRSMIKHINRQK